MSRLKKLTIDELLNVLHGTLACIEDAEKQVKEFRRRAETVLGTLRTRIAESKVVQRDVVPPKKCSTSKHAWPGKEVVGYGWMYNEAGRRVRDPAETNVIKTVKELYCVKQKTADEVVAALARLGLGTRTGREWTKINLWCTVLRPYRMQKRKRRRSSSLEQRSLTR